MDSSKSNKTKPNVRPLSNFELGLYAALVIITAIVQILLHDGKSLAETFAWIIVYAFLLAVVFFGWARSKSRQSEK